jgi:hypothetical protein
VPTSLTGAYELFCPNTPVGDIALNDAETTATVTPSSGSSVTAGSTFNVTNYQTVVNLPAQIVTAAAALGNSSIAGTATAQVDATGATPATVSVGPLTISVPIPSPVPDAGVSLSLPSTPQTVGPFTATTAAVTIQEDSAASLTLDVSGSNLSLTCNAYPNNSVATGITTSTPPGNPIAPVIAIANGGSQSTTTVPPVTTTTKAPATSPGGNTTTPPTTPVNVPSSQLAFTGPGPGVGMLGVVGGVLVLLGFALLALVDAPRRAMARLVVLGPDTVRRLRRGEFADRLAILNPMRKKQAGAPGLPDMAGNQPDAGVPQPDMSVEQPAMTVSQAAPVDTGWMPGPATGGGRGRGERLSRLPVAGRDIAQNTVRRAMRAGQWLLGR